MKRKVFFAVAIIVSMATWAQNIAVVSPSNSTDIYNTLDEAITNADPSSTIYLPGGEFVISDATTIDKKLTIIGVSHRGDTDNVDGATIISGKLQFVGGSSGSAVVGVYVSGNIDVGTVGTEEEGSAAVTNFTLRYCNVNSILVHNNGCVGILVNQCYLRNTSEFSNTNVKVSNCIVHSLKDINGGTINHNVVTSNCPQDIQVGRSIHIDLSVKFQVPPSQITSCLIGEMVSPATTAISPTTVSALAPGIVTKIPL